MKIDPSGDGYGPEKMGRVGRGNHGTSPVDVDVRLLRMSSGSSQYVFLFAAKESVSYR